MAQSLSKISLEAFKLQIHKIASRDLDDTDNDIKEMEDDLERKETAIMRELMSRKYLDHKRNPQDLIDYNAQTLKYAKKKRLF